MGSGPAWAPHLLCSHLGIGTTTYVLLLEAEANVISPSLFWGTAHPSSPGELPDVLLADVHTTRGGGNEQGQHQEEREKQGLKSPWSEHYSFSLHWSIPHMGGCPRPRPTSRAGSLCSLAAPVPALCRQHRAQTRLPPNKAEPWR